MHVPAIEWNRVKRDAQQDFWASRSWNNNAKSLIELGVVAALSE